MSYTTSLAREFNQNQHFALPEVDWSLDPIRRLAPIAFAMFVVILAQAVATSRAFAAQQEHWSQKSKP